MILQANAHPSILQKVGSGVEKVAGAIGTAKGLYEIGRSVLGAARAGAPYVRAAMTVL